MIGRAARRRVMAVVTASSIVAAGVAMAVTGLAAPAYAVPGTDASAPIAHDRVVSSVPASWTPQIKDGRVFAIAQVGATMVVGGTFTQVSPGSGSPISNRQRIVAFNATNGAISGSFNPTINGDVNALAPGPTNDTVYVGGSFSSVNGITAKIALLNVSSGATVSTFRAPGINAAVEDIVKYGNRLYVAGAFTTVGGTTKRGLVTLNATTGALDPFMNVQLTENHNWTPEGGGAKGAVGAKAISINPTGTKMVVIGNFRKADGLERRQAALVNLSGGSASVAADWRTNRYQEPCFNWAFDSYIRDVDFSPDGSYFVIVATGGPNPGTLCDTAARFTTTATGQAIEPVWIDDTGGDTLFSAGVTGAAVYTGGHQRWHNNAGGRDAAAPGSVPRPGLAAIDPRSGVPLSWNPGRQPRGVGAFVMQPTAAGLWIGQDTNYIGNFEYWRPRLAFFPLAGGSQYGPGATGDLPSNVYLGAPGAIAPTGGTILHRVNTGGPGIAATDGGPDWLADEGASSSLRNSGSNSAGWAPVPGVDGTVPSSTPSQIFDSERWDPGDSPEMSWALPVPAGTQVEVRLYLANRCGCTQGTGQRIFDVSVEGVQRLDDFDIVAAVGHDVGTMRSWIVTSDGTVNIDFGHVVENPLINGIEIVEPAPGPPPPAGGVVRRWYDGTTVGATQPAPTGDIDWSTVRGAVVIDGVLFYGTSNGNFLRRSFDGTTYASVEIIDPYNDPRWSGVDTGSGQTYRGVKPGFYSELGSIVGLAYADGKLYYTKSGSSTLFFRRFSPESGIVSPEQYQVPGSFPSIGGIFFAQGKLWFTDRANGNLSSVPWNGAPNGSPTVVSGPGIDGNDWRARVVFLGPGPGGGGNQPPVANFVAACSGLTCSVDGRASSDPNGSISSYAWSFGEGQTGSGAQNSVTYANAGTYTITLTVTDSGGASGSTTRSVTVAPPTSSSIQFVANATSTANTTQATVTVPASVQPGDALLLFVGVNSLNTTVSAPSSAGPWQQEGTQDSFSMRTVLHSRTAAAGDAGSQVAVTLTAAAKVDLQLVAYRGSAADPVAAVASSADASTTTHATPTVSVPAGGHWALSYWSDKSSSTTAWTPPAGVVERSEQIGLGSGRLTSLVADSGAAVPAGSYGGQVAMTDQTSSRGTNFTVLIAPA